MSASAIALLDGIIADVACGAVGPSRVGANAATAKRSAAPPNQKDPKSDAAAPATAASEPAAPDPEVERKFALVRSVGEECVSDAELRSLLKKPSFVLYDGFEPSGRMHIAQGVFKAMNVNKCTKAGGTFIFWVADWFALMNDKMGGDLERIKVVGEYLIHVWKAAGMDMSRVKFLWSSDEINKNARSYWTQALDIARRFRVERVKRCCQIMGRLEDSLTAAQILYPLMQCTDIFFLKADICQLGVDQRKVNMLAREYCDFAGIKLKPIILSHHMLYGLAKGQVKMSKSNKDSAIFMEDSYEDVERKMRNAYCPVKPENVEVKSEEQDMHLVQDALKNPCLDYVQHIIFCMPNATFVAAGKTYSDFAGVRDDFLSEKLSEEDLKTGLIKSVNLLLDPVRAHFKQNADASRILGLITEWMQEPKTVRASALRRLDALGDSGARGCCVVFAPLPSAKPTLGAALDTLRCLAAAPNGARRVLWQADWSAFCLNCLSGGKTREDDLKAIEAANELFVAGLRAIAPELMATVEVVVQSKAILSNSSDYWISVINAGRAFQLSQVRAVDEENPESGQVVSTLMHVADVLATASASTASTICLTPAQRLINGLASGYLARPDAAASGLKSPRLCEVASVSLRLRAASVDAAMWQDLDPDAELLLFDTALDVQRKMKKAFCEPGNVADCPVISVVAEAVLPYAADQKLVIKRKEDNGGDLTFTDAAALRTAYEAGLHPGDLKPAARDGVDSVLARVRAHVQASPALGKAAKEVEKVAKRSAKKK